MAMAMSMRKRKRGCLDGYQLRTIQAGRGRRYARAESQRLIVVSGAGSDRDSRAAGRLEPRRRPEARPPASATGALRISSSMASQPLGRRRREADRPRLRLRRYRVSPSAAALASLATSATFGSAGVSGSTKGIGFSSMPLWAKVMKRFQVIAGRMPPVRRRVGAKLSLPNQTDADVVAGEAVEPGVAEARGRAGLAGGLDAVELGLRGRCRARGPATACRSSRRRSCRRAPARGGGASRLRS